MTIPGLARVWPVVVLFVLFDTARWTRLDARSEPPAATEPGALRLDGVSEQVVNGYFKSDSWLRGLHEATRLGPGGLSILAFLIIAGTVTVIFARRQRGARYQEGKTALPEDSQPSQPPPQEPGPPAMRLARSLDSVDRRLLPLLVAGVVRVALVLAAAARWVDDYVLGGVARGVGWVGRHVFRGAAVLRVR